MTGTPAELLDRIAAGESQTLEFKSSFDKANIEKYGSGFIRIRKAMNDYPELSFSVQEISGGVDLTFSHTQAVQPASIDLAGQVAPEVQSLLGMLKSEMTRQQLQEAMSLNSRDNFDKRYGEDITIAQLAQAVSQAVGYEGKIDFDPSKPDGTPPQADGQQPFERTRLAGQSEPAKWPDARLPGFFEAGRSG